MTSRALVAMNVEHRIVIEASDYSAYIDAGHPPGRLLVLDRAYQDAYDTCDDLGTTKSKGPGPARNFIWEHSMREGYPWHWVMDDNIQRFMRSHQNRRIRVGDGTGFKIMEDFASRYTNVAMAGPAYKAFTPKTEKRPPFITNTRIYSCNLIRNDVPYRWRGRYNEDTILSLDMLKAGWCTVQFFIFLQDKVATQTMKGGNTAEFYAKEGTYAKSRMLYEQHTDITDMVWKFSRVHHHINYKIFTQPLVRRPDLNIPDQPNDYGLTITERRPR